jgi:hypothetical protein
MVGRRSTELVLIWEEKKILYKGEHELNKKKQQQQQQQQQHHKAKKLSPQKMKVRMISLCFF